MEPECRIQLEVFEGPLDLLLHLITRNRLSITDISISLVTNQYLEYLEFLKALDIEVAAEYLVMAATLMQIKSRMLLPVAEPVQDEDQPAANILVSLEELKRIKKLADLLSKQPILQRDVFPACQDIAPNEEGQSAAKPPEDAFDVTILDLMDAFKRVLGTRNMPKAMEIIRARVDMEGRMEQIEQTIKERRRMNFEELFPPGSPRHILIATFLSILELAKRGAIRIIQEMDTGRIFLFCRTGSQ